MNFDIKTIDAELALLKSKLAKNKEKITQLTEENAELKTEIKEIENFKVRFTKFADEYQTLNNTVRSKRGRPKKSKIGNQNHAESATEKSEKSENDSEITMTLIDDDEEIQESENNDEGNNSKAESEKKETEKNEKEKDENSNYFDNMFNH